MPVANPLVGGVPWDARQEQIKRALAEAAALRQGAGDMPKGQMVSGIYVAPHWSQQALPFVNALRGSVKEYDANRDQTNLDQQMAADAAQWMGARPQGQEVMLQGPQPEGVEGPLTGVTPPTMQEKMEWAQRGQTNPLTRALAAQYGADTLINEPVRQEQREFRSQEAVAARAARAEQWKAELEARAEAARQRAEDQRLSREERAAAAREANATRLQIAQLAADARRDAANIAAAARKGAADDKAKDLKPLPAAQSKAWVENETALGKIDSALGLLQDEKGEIRRDARKSMSAAYALPFAEDVGQRMDPKGVPLRAAIAGVRNDAAGDPELRWGPGLQAPGVP